MLVATALARRCHLWLLLLFACFGFLAQVSAQESPPERPGTGELRIEVVNEAGEGIEKVHLSLSSTPTEGAKPPQGSTDANGRLSLVVKAGVDCRISVRPKERGSQEDVDLKALLPGEVRDVRISLRTQPDLVVRRRLVWSGTEEPVLTAGVAILSEWEDYIPGQPADVHTGPEGVFTAKIKSWETTYGIVFGEGISPQGVLLNSLVEETPEVLIEVEDAASVIGSVEGSERDGLTAVISVKNQELPFAGRASGIHFGASSDVMEYRAAVLPSGRFEFLDLPGNVPLSLSIESDGKLVYERVSFLEVANGGTRQATIQLSQGLVIRGTLVDEDGKPVAGETVALDRGGLRGRVLYDWQEFDMKDRTDSSGRFELKGLAAGTWNVGPVSGDASAGIGVTLPVELEGSDVEVTLTQYEPRYVSGVVHLVDGAPADLVVHGQITESFSFHAKPTEPDGSFRLGPFPPGDVQLTARSTGSRWPYRYQADWEETVIPAGTMGVKLQLREAGGLSGQAVDGTTRQPQLAFFRMEQTGGGQLSVRVKPKPDFEFWGLLPGSHTIFASTIDGRYALRKFDVEASRAIEGRELRLKPGAFVSVVHPFSGSVFEKPGGHERLRIEVFHGGMLLHHAILSHNSTQRFTVPPGEVSVRAFIPRGSGSETAKLDVTRTLVAEEAETTVWDLGDL